MVFKAHMVASYMWTSGMSFLVAIVLTIHERTDGFCIFSISTLVRIYPVVLPMFSQILSFEIARETLCFLFFSTAFSVCNLHSWQCNFSVWIQSYSCQMLCHLMLYVCRGVFQFKLSRLFIAISIFIYFLLNWIGFLFVVLNPFFEASL